MFELKYMGEMHRLPPCGWDNSFLYENKPRQRQGFGGIYYFAIALTLAAKRDFLRAALFLWRTPF